MASLSDTEKGLHLYTCRVLKWDISECQVIVDDVNGDTHISNGTTVYLPTSMVISNESCKERTRQSKMDKFMLSHSTKAEERAHKLDDLLNSK